ncbi:VOC family protein [Humidisolicoccus flavus]|uniref:VOC family protein n=1 Tax=Humidisolicoccus flavus TaxID=3111414 RepID=UPI003252EFF8
MNLNDLLPDATAMGAVTLRTQNLARLEQWYTDGPGLSVLHAAPGELHLGSSVEGQATTLLVLREANDLRPPNPHDAGLFHTAILYPDEAALAAAIIRMSRSANANYVGSADHDVSRAFYFADPDGNGVELYADRPRSEWTWNSSGGVVMGSAYLDPNQFVHRFANEDAPSTALTTVGHVHLQVGDISSAREFYVDTLGFAETATYGGKALFVSAGGYHHHMAMNVWNSAGAGRRAETLGLGVVDIVLPDHDAIGAAVERFSSRGVAAEHDGNRVSLRDPWNNLIRLSTEHK